MSEEGIEEGADDTPLWVSSVQDESGGCAPSHPNVLIVCYCSCTQ